jgi:hypothetical protein
MESLTWFLTFALLASWIAVGVGIFRTPPRIPAGWRGASRRLLWGTIWAGALLGGLWGPSLWSTVSTDHADRSGDLETGAVTTTVIRTPAAVQVSTLTRDTEGGVLVRESRLTLQLPLGLLLFFGVLHLVRRREGEPGSGGGGPVLDGDAGARRTATALLAIILLAGCGDSYLDAHGPRAEREIREVRWDTLVHLEIEVADTLLFSADDVATSDAGLWVLDRIGYRVAHLDWTGEVQWYAGGRGAGPGEFMNPRSLDLDREDRVWVVDIGTHRITGFDDSGSRMDEINLQEMEGALHDFRVTPDADRFHGMLLRDGLHPVEVRRDGRVREGRPIRIADTEGEPLRGISLQGAVAGNPDDDRWAYAFTMGDGLFRMRGLDLEGGRILPPEEVPFPRMIEERSESGNTRTTIQRLTEPNFSASAITIADGRILLPFLGESPHAGRVVEVFDLETGDYLESVTLPRPGTLAVHGDRWVLAWNTPTPGLMVLRER